MEETVTYMQMVSPLQLRAAPPVEGLSLRRATSLDDVRNLHTAIGAPHHWARCTWNDAQWEKRLRDPRHTQWIFTLRGATIGALEVGHGKDGSAEIVVFGLLAKHTGKGIGGYALTLAVSTAWQTQIAADAEPRLTTKRIWLLTSSLDHPRALSNYLHRGFSVFHKEIRENAAGKIPSTPKREVSL
ncbi:hypothetical protein [Streptomyces sp. NPDC088748]|uniref:hypothetical protein n=1 Tax=Streptomyces sp. NPDC088748 TaxID=3365887 RepID=UPI0037FC51C4